MHLDPRVRRGASDPDGDRRRGVKDGERGQLRGLNADGAKARLAERVFYKLVFRAETDPVARRALVAMVNAFFREDVKKRPTS